MGGSGGEAPRENFTHVKLIFIDFEHLWVGSGDEALRENFTHFKANLLFRLAGFAGLYNILPRLHPLAMLASLILFYVH